MTAHIKSILDSLLGCQDTWQLKLLAQWDDIVGKLKTKVVLLGIMQDTAVLGVTDSCWMQELYLLSPLLIKTINNHLPQPYIKNVRFKSVGIKKEKKKSQPLVSPKIAPVSCALSAHEADILESIKDPELALALKNYLMRCRMFQS